MANNLWQKDGVQKAQSILRYYLKEKAKCLFTTSGEHYDGMPPNHPAITDMNASAKTERIGSADYYCSHVDTIINEIKEFGKKDYPLYAQILQENYCDPNDLTVRNEARRLSVGHTKYYESLPKALYVFAYYCPDSLMETLLNYQKK